MNKYVTWSSGKYYEGQGLYDSSACVNIINSLRKTQQEVYATIQDYDSNGDCIGCPLYFDIDAPSLYDAWENARQLVSDIEDEFNVSSLVWFSGGKGFHVLTPLYIRHPRCHEIMKLIIEDSFKHIDLDMKVYRTRSMFRVENTWNIKGKKYKIPLDNWNQLSLEKIYAMADKQVTPQWRDKWNCADLDISSLVGRLPEFKPIDISSTLHFDDMMPCLKRLWGLPTPPQGSRHEIAYMVVKHCYRAGLSPDEAASLFYSHPFWKNVNDNDYRKIIRSVYTKGNAALGCKHNELLQANCVVACIYNKGFDIIDHIGG